MKSTGRAAAYMGAVVAAGHLGGELTLNRAPPLALSVTHGPLRAVEAQAWSTPGLTAQTVTQSPY
jgi:hypothetical protein